MKTEHWQPTAFGFAFAAPAPKEFLAAGEDDPASRACRAFFKHFNQLMQVEEFEIKEEEAFSTRLYAKLKLSAIVLGGST